MDITASELASHIDQTLLKPTIGFAAASEWMDAQVGAGFASLCVSPFLVPLASQKLAGTDTLVCSVCSFPLGYSNTESKAEEAAHLVQLGCVEVDMVMNIAAFLEDQDTFVHDDIAAVVASVDHESNGTGIVKVILETGYLDDEGIDRASRLCAKAGAHYVKTSTGFGPRGASVRDVEIMRAAVGSDLGVKAAGGIRDLETALAMIEAGASRIGASAGLEIVGALAPRA
ncbi:MAG: deoxyribose-phosphate aldolase [Actinomycetota bacterium]|jgi:deoxyribose-phosphate aldolase|nr:deoxyribose-phosphate aldolase [Actinomycetota bacterium]